MKIRFGPSGNSNIFYDQGYKHTIEAMKWLADLGLSAYEYSFGRGINIGEETAKKIGNQAKEHDIFLSVHAPYYINFANPNKEKRDQSAQYLIDSCKAAEWLGAHRVVFHAGSCAKLDRQEAFAMVKNEVESVIQKIADLGLGHMQLCPETMGKLNQIGDLSEVLALCQLSTQIIPAIDFGHLHARSFGKIKTQEDYAQILDEMEKVIGYEKTSAMHVHFSHIEYTQAGEKRHLTFEDKLYGPFFEPLAELVCTRGYTPNFICESKNTMAEDALTMKQIYEFACTARRDEYECKGE